MALSQQRRHQCAVSLLLIIIIIVIIIVIFIITTITTHAHARSLSLKRTQRDSWVSNALTRSHTPSNSLAHTHCLQRVGA